jgi:arylformamidase
MRRTFWRVGSAAMLAVALFGCSSGADTSSAGPKPKQPGEATPRSSSRNCAQPGLPTTVAYKSVAGVDSNLLSLDIYPPKHSCDAPVVMWVHGGGYSIGDKSKQVDDKVRLVNEKGWIFVSVNYRLTKPGQPLSAQYPDHYLDVAASVAWVHTNIADYGGDPTKIALLGHSAGADIVSNVVTNPEYLAQNGLGLDAVVCAGPLDTEGFDKQAASGNDPNGEKRQWQQSLGNDPNYLTDTSATRSVKAGIGIPPMIGVVRGTAERQRIETDFLKTLASAGIPATTIDARALSHQQVNAEIGAPGDTVMTEPLVKFLTSCFTP